MQLIEKAKGDKMKNSLVIMIGLIVIAAVITIMFRFDVDVNSPVVSKMDRWTGKVWIVNGGAWMPIK